MSKAAVPLRKGRCDARSEQLVKTVRSLGKPQLHAEKLGRLTPLRRQCYVPGRARRTGGRISTTNQFLARPHFRRRTRGRSKIESSIRLLEMHCVLLLHLRTRRGHRFRPKTPGQTFRSHYRRSHAQIHDHHGQHACSKAYERPHLRQVLQVSSSRNPRLHHLPRTPQDLP